MYQGQGRMEKGEGEWAHILGLFRGYFLLHRRSGNIEIQRGGHEPLALQQFQLAS
jgi:hypothetical protein